MDKEDQDRNVWPEYSRLVLSELKRLDRDIKSNGDKIDGKIEILDDKIDAIKSDDLAFIKAEINLLKFKSSLWGTLAGGVMGIIIAALAQFFGL